MLVYIESNFVLQLALQQEEAGYAEAILAYAEAGRTEIAFPSIAITEPLSTITYRGLERRRLYNSLTSELTQLRRSAPHQNIALALQVLLVSWAEIEKKEVDLLQSSIQRVLSVSTRIELDSTTFQHALNYQRLYDLSPQDSIVYSSVIADLNRRAAEEPKCFVSTNRKDFGDPIIKAELATFNCRYIATLGDCESFIQSTFQQ